MNVHSVVAATTPMAAATCGSRTYHSHAAMSRAVSEIVADSPRIAEFHAAIGPVTPSASITSRSPIRTRRSCAIDDATDANTHQQAAASTTWPAILDVLVGSSL